MTFNRRRHYYYAAKLARMPCKAMLLVQRSSSLLLGPEDGWPAERAFYEAIYAQQSKNIAFYHIVSLDGIRTHIRRKQNAFPNALFALGRLQISDTVAFCNAGGSWLIKKLPAPSAFLDIKVDRQARTFLIQHADGGVEGVLIEDIGSLQASFWIQGVGMQKFFHECVKFYRQQCDPLTRTDVDKIKRAIRNSYVKSCDHL